MSPQRVLLLKIGFLLIQLFSGSYIGRSRAFQRPVSGVVVVRVRPGPSGLATAPDRRCWWTRSAVLDADIDEISQLPINEEESDSSSASAFGPSDNADVGSLSSRRGKVNEINFCMAPADASLSRAYGGATPSGSAVSNTNKNSDDNAGAAPVLSMTRALNNASNRAVRRILLARSWPSAEALNLSLRRVMEAEREATRRLEGSGPRSAKGDNDENSSSPKCPVPRPILNVLTRKRSDVDEGTKPRPRGRTDAEYVADQLTEFRARYGSLPGYGYAEAYLDSILSLATSGVESIRVQEVLDSGVYDDAYRRIKGVLRTVGVVFVEDSETGRPVIAKKLIDQDICLSVIDKISIQRESEVFGSKDPESPPIEGNANDERNNTTTLEKSVNEQEEAKSKIQVKRRLPFWRKKQSSEPMEDDAVVNESSQDHDESPLSRDDLGGVLLSSDEPTMTRQLNALSNIVLRALLFGGSRELLVLSETLDADRAAFVERWYAPSTTTTTAAAAATRVPAVLPVEEETRPGVQFFNCLVALLRNCYNNGVVTNLQPPLPLGQSYANAYERLVATAVELGSGCLKPAIDNVLMTMPTPRTAAEEFSRFAVWETNFRVKSLSSEASAHPEDLQGSWEVRDVIGGETIGVSTVRLCEDGQVELAEPLEGLRWRCDPGPTHLDTCTFQVLASDGTILQYRGFVDRGARLEARISKRPISVRGSVMFQMRDGSIDYFRDMLPISYREGTTNFVMTKIVDKP